jgi:DNA-binding HxlR family transcriptional regulator
MLGTDYQTQVCSIARSLEVVGERWTFLIVRNLFLGLRRFDEIQANLGIARNVLSARLDKLVEHGIVETRQYSDRPPRHEYVLTDKGRDLWPALIALMQWGDRHDPAPGGPPTVIVHRGCGGGVDSHRVCLECGKALELHHVQALAGPGASPGHPLRRRTATAAG